MFTLICVNFIKVKNLRKIYNLMYSLEVINMNIIYYSKLKIVIMISYKSQFSVTGVLYRKE